MVINSDLDSLIAKFQAYGNIKYLRLAKTINIYEAWNLAIKESKSEFITNANVDDLHRKDAFALKIQASYISIFLSNLKYLILP